MIAAFTLLDILCIIIDKEMIRMLKEIWNRQSIRKYDNRKVEKEKIEELLRAAMNAPTARNTQSWRFIVVTNKEALEHMIDLQPYTGMMKTAYCTIIVMGDQTASQPDEYLYVDGAAAIENMLIEAVHQGLGTCWCAIAPSKERIDNFRTYYHIEKHLIPIAAVAVGYGAERKEKQDRYDPAKVTWFQ